MHVSVGQRLGQRLCHPRLGPHLEHVDVQECLRLRPHTLRTGNSSSAAHADPRSQPPQSLYVEDLVDPDADVLPGLEAGEGCTSIFAASARCGHKQGQARPVSG